MIGGEYMGACMCLKNTLNVFKNKFEFQKYLFSELYNADRFFKYLKLH